MLGLDVGGSCHGIAYRVAEPEKAAVADYLYRRELVTDGYQALLHPAHLVVQPRRKSPANAGPSTEKS